MDPTNPLGNTPPPIEGIAPWWPLIGMMFSLVLAAASAMWAAWLQYQEWKRKRDDKLIDKEKEHAIQSEQRKQAVEIEELKLTFAARQQVIDSLRQQFDSLSKQYETQLDEGRKMRDELAKARQELRERDDTIGELRGTIADLQIRIKHLEKELTALEVKQTKHEQRHDVK
jgi:chromosome segregation ATPase